MRSITEVECVCLDCDWEGFTGDCVTEDNADETLQCPLCRAAVHIDYTEEELRPVGKSGDAK